MPQVIIRRGDDGMELGIDSADFRRGKHFQQLDGTHVTYADAGFRNVSLANGQPYTGPLNEPSAERKAD
jgi:hypothetical protein